MFAQKIKKILKGQVGIAEIWRFLNLKITAVAVLDF